MALAIKSNHNLEDMEKLILASDFNLIENKDLTPQKSLKHKNPYPISSWLGSSVKFNVDSDEKTILLTY